jgi:hypothetical protein
VNHGRQYAKLPHDGCVACDGPTITTAFASARLERACDTDTCQVARTKRPRLNAIGLGIALVLSGALMVEPLWSGAEAAFASGDATSATCPYEAEAAAGFQSFLPDCRVYEMVSPPHKNGAKVVLRSPNGLAPAQASASGDAITYLVNSPIEDAVAGNSAEDRVLSTGGGGEWSSRDISPGHKASAELGTEAGEYRVFSEDLTSSVINLDESLDLRNSATSLYEPLVTPTNVTAEAKAEVEQKGGGAEFRGANPDDRNIVFGSGLALTPGSTRNQSYESLYEWSNGLLRLVSVLPEGVPANTTQKLSHLGGGYEGFSRDARNAISGDGTRVFWEAATGGETHLYMRDFQTARTTMVDAAQGVAEVNTANQEPEDGLYETASRDGSIVFFRDGKNLTSDATAGGNHDDDLYAFDTESGQLTDLTVDPQHGQTGETANVRSAVLGASEDGTYVYFVADGVLAEGATPGDCEGSSSPTNAACNLYVAHLEGGKWKTAFIASLASEDSPDWGYEESGDEGDAYQGLGTITSRVSPDGSHVAFMSQRRLTGYNNSDAETGAADEEVYFYDAVTRKLTCASCNPSGARPVGLLDTGEYGHGRLVDPEENWTNHVLAANIPSWSAIEASRLAFYQSRYLSDSGRLFFNSDDPLVPQATNGIENVYEYEPEGTGDCSSGPRTVHPYGGEGCLALVSSGTSTEESAFADASATGNDVFFVTSAKLVSEDVDDLYDMYDAHACNTESPCPSAQAPARPACTTSESCQGPGASAPIFPAGASLAAGGGDLPLPVSSATGTAKAKPLSNAQKLSRALRACRKDKRKHTRIVCERKARKRYPPPKKTTKVIHSGDKQGGKR